jgi:hypothetical protein
MIINNMVVLGRAAPELYKGRQSATVIGYSKKHGFIRLYPTRIDSPLKQWSIADVEVEKSPTDKRRESWRLLGSKDAKNWEHLNRKIKVAGMLSHKGRIMLAKRLAGSLESLENSGSIALVKPQNITPIIERAGQRKIQKTLTQFDIINKDDYEARLFLEYSCGKLCRKLHRHWVIEWGVYEALRKNPGKPEKMLADLHLNDKRYDKYLLLGSKRGNRKEFVIVSVLRFKQAWFGREKIRQLEKKEQTGQRRQDEQKLQKKQITQRKESEPQTASTIGRQASAGSQGWAAGAIQSVVRQAGG